MKLIVGIKSRDWIEFEEVDGKEIQLRAKGCLPFLRKVEKLRQCFHQQNYKEVSWISETKDHGDLLIEELLQKLQSRYLLPYQEEELCHCRAVPTEEVVDSIQAGATNSQSVGKMCSAGTSCGSCKPDIDACIQWIYG